MDSNMAAGSRPARLPWIDALRGIAIAAMVVFHFSWDLSNFGFISVDVGRHPYWVIFARSIATSFLALVGVGLVLWARQGFDLRRFLIRLAMIVAGAAAVSAATYYATPNVFVFFGILHLIALSSVLGLLFVRLPGLVLVALSAAWFAVWWYFEDTFFDHPYLLWVGLGTATPNSNDYTPIFPWFGAVLAGMAVAKLVLASGRVTAALARPAPRPLTFAGRHSLAIYLIHQPLLFGLTYLAAQTIPPSVEVFRTRHLENCTEQCIAAQVAQNPSIMLDPTGLAGPQSFCHRGCECVARKLEEDGLWQDLIRGRFSETENGRYMEFAQQCVAEVGPD